MDYYDCDLPSTDYVNFGGTEWNLPLLIQPRKTLSNAYGNNAPYFCRYPRNVYPCHSKRHREFQSFQNNQFSKNEIIPRKSFPSHDWNFPMKNVPTNGNRYNATMLSRRCSPYNLRSRFNSPCTQSNGDEFQLQKYPNELNFPKNTVRMRNIMQWESEYSEIQNFGNFNAPPDLWDYSIVQTSSDPSCNRNIPISRSSLQSPRSVGSVSEVIHSQNKEIPCITYPQPNLDSTEPIISISPHDTQTGFINNAINAINSTEKSNLSLDKIHYRNITEKEVHLRTPKNSLDLMEENALSEYFLNDFCLNSQVDDKMFDLSPNNQNISSDNIIYNMFEDKTVNSVEHDNFFDQIKDLELGIASKNNELYANETNLIKNLNEKSVTEIGDTQFKESTNEVSEESSGYLTDNTHEKCSRNKQDDDSHLSIHPFKETKEHDNLNYANLTENLNTNTLKDVEDVSFKENTDISGLKLSNSKILDSSRNSCSHGKLGKNGNLSIPTKVMKNKTNAIKNKRSSAKRELGSDWKNIDDKINKCTAEEKLIFHAPIININNQNQISTSFNSKKWADVLDSQFYNKLGNDIMDLLCSVQTSTTVGQNSDGKFSREDNCLSPKENFRLSPNERDTSQMNVEVPNSSLESTFIYSNDLETLPNQIETSLSSVTNYILDEPLYTPIKHCDTASGSNEYFPLNKNLEDNSESIREKRERKSSRKKMRNNEIALFSSLKSYPASENCIDSCMMLPENIFQHDSPEYSSTVEHPKITLKNSLNRIKNKRRKINWKKWNHIVKRLVRSKLGPIGFLKKSKDGRKIKAFNQNSNNLYKEAFSQTSEIESNLLSEADVIKQDAQTQWDVSHIKKPQESSEHEKPGYKETRNKKAGEILCKQEEIIKYEKVAELKFEINNISDLKETQERNEQENTGHKESSSKKVDKILRKQEEIIKYEKEVEFKSKGNKCNWNLRPRRFESTAMRVNSSLKRTRSKTNVQSPKHNTLNSSTNIKQNNNRKKSSKIENRPSPSKIDEVSEKQIKNSSFTNKKQNKKNRIFKRTTRNVSLGSQRNYGKLKNDQMLGDLGAYQIVSSAESCAVKTTKTSNNKRNKKKN